MSPLVVKFQVKLHFPVTLLLSFADTGTAVCQDRKVHRSQPKDFFFPFLSWISFCQARKVMFVKLD